MSGTRSSRYRPSRRGGMTMTSTSSMFSDPQLESLLGGLATNEAENLIRTSALIQHISYRDRQLVIYNKVFFQCLLRNNRKFSSFEWRVQMLLPKVLT